MAQGIQQVRGPNKSTLRQGGHRSNTKASPGSSFWSARTSPLNQGLSAAACDCSWTRGAWSCRTPAKPRPPPPPPPPPGRAILGKPYNSGQTEADTCASEGRSGRELTERGGFAAVLSCFSRGRQGEAATMATTSSFSLRFRNPAESFALLGIRGSGCGGLKVGTLAQRPGLRFLTYYSV